MLHLAFFKDAPFPMLIFMPEFSVGTVSHYLNIAVWMERPHGARRESIVIKNTQGAPKCAYSGSWYWSKE